MFSVPFLVIASYLCIVVKKEPTPLASEIFTPLLYVVVSGASASFILAGALMRAYLSLSAIEAAGFVSAGCAT